MSRNMLYTPTSTGPQIGLDAVIEELLGRGFGYADWEKELVTRGFTWSLNLRNIIIDKEFWYFKKEIEQLLLEPSITQGTNSKSNSIVSILKRLKGEEWVEGIPDERETRLRTRRLFGKDGK
jgi:hypothetical protein